MTNTPRRSSTATVRAAPVARLAKASAGGLVVHGEALEVTTGARVEIVDLTDRVMGVVRELGVGEGLVSLWSMHTTCALFINEAQDALLADITAFLEAMVPREGRYRHNDPAFSDCDRANADSHLRAMLLGHSLALQVSAGEPVLGQWQRILMAELDGPRPRTVRLQVWGIAA
ncbi:MAG: secondary thiamine-phosphate synthase enzyme YjbQ [Acidobacteriota bacterium]